MITVYGINDPSKYFGNWFNANTKVELAVGDLVALDTDGKLIKATHEHRPLGVVKSASVMEMLDAYAFTGERDGKKLRVGEKVSCTRYFLVGGYQDSEITGISGAKIGDPIYLGDSGLTCTKPASGFLVGSIERKGDNLIRFNLDLSIVKIGEE